MVLWAKSGEEKKQKKQKRKRKRKKKRKKKRKEKKEKEEKEKEEKEKEEKEKEEEKGSQKLSLRPQAQYRGHERHLESLLDHLAEEVLEQEDSSPWFL
jgi:hypothetical protein